MELIRAKANPEDIATFCALEEKFSGLKTYSNMSDPAEAKEELEKCLVYFIKINNETVGSISYEWKNQNHAYIAGLTIIPEFQGRGLAREAMVKILAEIGEIQRIDLVTHPENAKAIKLYQSLGFKIESQKENYYGDGEPRVIMAKNHA